MTESADAGTEWDLNPDRTLLAVREPGSGAVTCWPLAPSGQVTVHSPTWTLDTGGGPGWRLLGWASPHVLALWRREGGRSALRLDAVTDPAAPPACHRLVGRPVACAVAGDRTEVLVALSQAGRAVTCLHQVAGDSYLILRSGGVERTGAWDPRARLVAAHSGAGVELFGYDEEGLAGYDVDWPDGVTPVESVGGEADAIGLTGSAADGRIVPGLLHGPSRAVRWFPEHTGYTCAEVAPSGRALLLAAWEGEQYRYRIVDPAGALVAEPPPHPGLATDLRFSADEAHLVGWHQSPAQPPRLATWDIHTGATGGVRGASSASAVPMRWIHRWFAGATEPLPEWHFEPDRGARRCGVVVYLHGGPRTRLNQAYDPVIATLVRRGWSVLGMNYPGSSGYGAEYRERTRNDWGGEDAVAVARRVRALSAESSGSPVCLYGHSYGGYLALLVAAEVGPLLDGVAVWAPITDLPLLVESVSGVQRRWLDGELGSQRSDARWLRARSPVDRLSSLAHVRLLIGHGARDERCPVEQSRRLAAGLPGNQRYLEDAGGSHTPSDWQWWADEVAAHYEQPAAVREVAG